MKRILFFTLLALPLSAQSANFDVAHLREQGQDMIIFPMDSSIDYKSDRSKQEIMYALQLCASSARLAGTASNNHGINEAFSTGSQNHQPPQPNS